MLGLRPRGGILSLPSRFRGLGAGCGPPSEVTGSERERSGAVGQKLDLDFGAIAQLCKTHGVRELSLFGSVLREDFGSHSDVDVLIQFEPGAEKGLLEYCRILEELEALFGRKVDLVTPDGLSPYLKDRILASRQVVYGSGA